jgi:hypothetical protein
MATVGAKNQPIVQTTDTFNPVSDINTLANWVANNYASFKILTSTTVHGSLTGADLFAGLVVWEQSTGQFWQYDGSAWALLGLGTVPRIELTNTSGSAGFFVNNTTTTLSTWTTTMNRGGFTVASGVVTVPVTGRYNIYYQMGFGSQASASGTRIIRISTSASVVMWNSTAPVNSQGSYMTLSATGVQLTASTTLTPAAFQTSGSTLDWVATASAPSKFVIEYIGA